MVDSKKHRVVKLLDLPKCDFCHTATAAYDGKTISGPWAYMCEKCADMYGVSNPELMNRLEKKEDAIKH